MSGDGRTKIRISPKGFVEVATGDAQEAAPEERIEQILTFLAEIASDTLEREGDRWRTSDQVTPAFVADQVLRQIETIRESAADVGAQIAVAHALDLVWLTLMLETVRHERAIDAAAKLHEAGQRSVQKRRYEKRPRDQKIRAKYEKALMERGDRRVPSETQIMQALGKEFRLSRSNIWRIVHARD